jgi:threonyl-tRNA synthetase
MASLVAETEKMSIDDSKRELQRATKEVGDRMTSTGLIGGELSIEANSNRYDDRNAVFDRLWALQEEKQAALPDDKPIKVTLPDGTVKDGTAFKTSPLDIATAISKGLADSCVIAKVLYSNKLDAGPSIVACDEAEEGDDEDMLDDDDEKDGSELWDMSRPLVGDCTLKLLKFDDPEAKTVFWHSSAHVLGAALELTFGSHLTIGPALQTGFYYDSYMGKDTVGDEELKKIEASAQAVCKKKHPFQRLVVTKAEAQEMFAQNPFKANLIANKVPEGSVTTVYRCGALIDLCMGPHLPHTGAIKAFATVKSSATNWLGQVTNDPLQRVYGVSFPDKAQLKEWKEFQEQAKKRDHRLIGTKQELFFFHQLSPGSCFWLPHGARINNKLVDFIKKQLWARGYEEVMTPNMFNTKLWETSGHLQHYKENLFTFPVEGQDFGLKPMNCPGHCVLFAHRLRSYRELPMRVADFGVLHRNELSGALSGLTRVRRFQQDDGHIFCRSDQIQEEVLGALDFMKYVYDIFGMSYKLELSTRPKKAMGSAELWNYAEGQLQGALNQFAGEGQWRVNKGDGAFYGPKIDIKVFDAMKRVHQCATIQLDFQLPIRFDLTYKSGAAEGEGADADATAAGGDKAADPGAGLNSEGVAPGLERPVMIHRAMLGSVERMTAVLTEHWGGKWPFWLSPRQCVIVPVDMKFVEYAYKLQNLIHEAGFYVDVDDSSRTLNKKVREGQVAQYNYILVVGEKEVEAEAVAVRTRDKEGAKTMKVTDLLAMFKELDETYAPNPEPDVKKEPDAAASGDKKGKQGKK